MILFYWVFVSLMMQCMRNVGSLDWFTRTDLFNDYRTWIKRERESKKAQGIHLVSDEDFFLFFSISEPQVQTQIESGAEKIKGWAFES